MNLFKYILFLILIIHSLRGYSQKATFEVIPTGGFEVYDSLIFSVNGISLAEYSKTYTVPVRRSGLDTIAYRERPGKEEWYIVTKLRPGERYRIVPNGCSTFEIVPKHKTNELCLVRMTTVNEDSSRLYLNSYYCFVDPEQICTKDTTDYFVNASSGYCPYAITSFNMCGKDLDHIEKPEDTEDCHGLIMHFTGGEMYTLRYDYKTQALSVSFDGYYSRKKKVKIAELPDK